MGIENIYAGWLGILCGIIYGAVIGMFFHKESWLGGYNSFERRMIRLAHISFFGLGFINILFGLTAIVLKFSDELIVPVSFFFMVGAITMPIVCTLTAIKKYFRLFFPLPVASIMSGLLILILNWV